MPARPDSRWLPDGTLVVSTLFAAQLHHADARGNVTATYDVSDIAWSTNDLLVAPDGRTYVDLYIADGGRLTGGIGLVAPDGAVRVVAAGLSMPNGLAFLPDESTLVVSETHGSRLLAFTAGPTAASVRRPCSPTSVLTGTPTGCASTPRGGVWVGCYDTGEFLRVIAGGEITHRIEIDRGWAAAAPALGGHDGRTLYLVVDDTTHEGLLAGSSTGRILQARVDIPGVGSP